MGELIALVSFGNLIVHVYFTNDEHNPYSIYEVKPAAGEIEMKYVDKYCDLFSVLCWMRDKGYEIGEIRTNN